MCLRCYLVIGQTFSGRPRYVLSTADLWYTSYEQWHIYLTPILYADWPVARELTYLQGQHAWRFEHATPDRIWLNRSEHIRIDVSITPKVGTAPIARLNELHACVCAAQRLPVRYWVKPVNEHWVGLKLLYYRPTAKHTTIITSLIMFTHHLHREFCWPKTERCARSTAVAGFKSIPPAKPKFIAFAFGGLAAMFSEDTLNSGFCKHNICNICWNYLTNRYIVKKMSFFV